MCTLLALIPGVDCHLQYFVNASLILKVVEAEYYTLCVQDF